MSIQHTATPWAVDAVGPHQDDIINDETGFSIARMSWAGPNSAVSKANAAYIVRCVNSHEALVAALEDMINRYCDDESLDSELDERARAVLSLAKATS